MLKLYTFNISHFSEKARWALDYEGIAYEERVLLPGPHQLVTRRIARRYSRSYKCWRWSPFTRALWQFRR